jgi:hypothetical protein
MTEVNSNWFDRVVKWNEERGLLDRGFNHQNEMSFIIEELLESTGKFSSETARPFAKSLAAGLVRRGTADTELLVDSWADMIVFATGAIAKLGYDPAKVMEEVFREINSRTGTLVDGKFVKDQTAVLYVADFNKCLATS